MGSAGGNEILSSLWFGASAITGIELNPVTISLLTTHFADFTGHIADHPKVRLVNAEARAFLQETDERFDLIWLVAPDSYAAMNAATSGAFVLSESYLYTEEMIRVALEHLEPGGILCAQFGEIDFDGKPNRTLRFLGTAREALAELGVGSFADHVLVGYSPGYKIGNATIMLRKEPFSRRDVDRFVASVGKVDRATAVYGLGALSDNGLIREVIELDGADRTTFYDAYPFKVGPIDDDSPFFWNFVPFMDVIGLADADERLTMEEGIGERILLVFLVFATIFAAVFLLTPLLVARRTWRTIPFKLEAGIYFASLGLGFMLLEVSLIQKLTLFLGYPTYSLTVTLFALLVSAGLGSLLSERLRGDRNRTLRRLGATLVVLVVLYQLAMPALVDSAVGLPFAAKVLLTIGLLVPLGLCLGAFMPLGIRSVAGVTPHREEFVAWCWSVNGFFSVMTSVLSTLLSMSFGFRVVMVCGAGVYLIGISALRRIPAG